MWIRKVEFKNFKPYVEEEIPFPKQENVGNITIIKGGNGFGKTSFLEAIEWCFYGEKGTTYSKTEDMVYRYGEIDEMSVRVVFEHEGDRYEIERIATLEKQAGVTKVEPILKKNESLLFADESEKKKQRVINRILPRNIHQFFLLKGERTEHIAERLGEEELREEISQLLGLMAVRYAKEDLKSKVLKEFQTNLEKTASKSKEAEELTEQKQEREEEKEELRDEKSGLEEEISEQEKLVEKLKSRIGELGDIEELMKEYEDLGDEKKKLEKEKKKRLSELKDVMKGNYISILEDEIKKARGKIQDKYEKLSGETKDTIRLELEKELLEYARGEERCKICEQDTTNVKERLKEKLEKLSLSESSEDIAHKLSRVENIRSELSRVSDKVSSSDPSNIKEKIDELDEEIGNIESERDEVKEKMGNRDERFEELSEQLSTEKSKLDGLKDKLEGKEEEISDKNKEIDELNGEIERKSPSDEETEIIKRQIDLTEKIIKKLDKIEKEGIKKKREAILGAMNEILESMTAGERNFSTIEFKGEESYAPQLYTESGDKPNMKYDISDGEKRVVTYIFLLGLNRYTERDAPLILDEPFADLDGGYRENFSNLLGGLDNQTILLLRSTSLAAGEVKKILNQSKNKELNLRRDREENLTKTEEVK